MQMLLEFGYVKTSEMAEILPVHFEILKVGVNLAQALAKLKSSPEGLPALKTVLKHAQCLYKEYGHLQSKIPERDPMAMANQAEEAAEAAQTANTAEIGTGTATAEANAETQAMASAGEASPPAETAENQTKQQQQEQNSSSATDMDFGLDMSQWALAVVEPVVVVEDKDKNKDTMGGEAPLTPEKTPEELLKETQDNLERIHMDIFHLESFKPFEDMLFGENQDHFPDAVLKQIAGQNGRLGEAYALVKRNIATVLPLENHQWRKDVSGDTPKEEAIAAAAKEMISKVQVKGEPFIKMVDTLHQDPI